MKRALVFSWADVRPYQTIEHLWFCELAWVGALSTRLYICQTACWRMAVLGLVLLQELVGPKSLVANLALGKRINKGRQVTARLPDLWSQNDGRIKTYDVFARAHHRVPPLLLDVFFQLNAQGAVVPSRASAPVNLTRRVNKSSSLTEVYEGFVAFYRHPRSLSE